MLVPTWLPLSSMTLAAVSTDLMPGQHNVTDKLDLSDTDLHGKETISASKLYPLGGCVGKQKQVFWLAKTI